MWYNFAGTGGQAVIPVPVERVSEILEMNMNGQLPESLLERAGISLEEKLEYTNGAGQGSLTRFDTTKSNKKKKKKRRPSRNQRNN